MTLSDKEAYLLEVGRMARFSGSLEGIIIDTCESLGIDHRGKSASRQLREVRKQVLSQVPPWSTVDRTL